MCRFLVYRGSDEILLSKLILDPTHSILKQSFDSRLRLDTRRGQNNADGFGIGFYTDPKLGQAPCLFTSTIPAWNCTNLQRIASKTASRLIFAHVRATTEGSLSEDNCHPFCHGSLMWMHNGGLGGWKHIKRRLAERLADKWYLGVTGGTDSEWAFALFLDTLERMGQDPSSQPVEGFGPTILRKALLKTIALINELIDQIPESVIQSDNIDTRSLLNFAVSDGHSIICTRYISSSTDEAASLYYSSGTEWEKRTVSPTDRAYQMERRDKGADIVLVASEPLTFERENWVNVPTNSILTIHNQTVMVHPIVDQFYDRSPYHVRSSAFVQAKGLAANEKASTLMTPSIGASMAASDLQKRVLTPTIPFGVPLGRPADSTVAAPVKGRPQSGLQELLVTSPDARSITTLSSGQSSASRQPVRRNIKVKRKSLSSPDQLVTATQAADQQPAVDDSDTDSPEQQGHGIGHPHKLSRFFPELTMN
ncbi:nucleophile aminohydrolase [Plectosphaerella cucumerina]|uniref:Nucleophile aminohydrolase n=1 Tax=Plectosphaerella cucumerina TaxID=40658 RepID=A0A8K0TE74_9PEZI|nr:nucleophile aminohydrolase [Plectosphaerella cucumerina]